MAKKIPFVTPIGVARWPHLSEPDSTGKFADNKYKTKLIVSKKDAKPLIDNLKTTAKALGVSKLPFAEDPDNPDNVVFVAKSKYKPAIFDPKKKEISGDITISGGSKVRLAGILFPYDTGISMQLKQVQVIDLVSASEDPMFDEVEGSFDASDYDAPSKPTFGELTENEMDI